MTELLVQVGTEEQIPPGGRVVEHPAWPVLKDAVERIRPWQSKDGSIINRSCSGAYFAPRVVATAAHCLDADPERGQQVLQVLAYFGDDFATDFAQLPSFGVTYQVPAPGTPSNWAAADSFETHPKWDRQLIHPDLGAVYLDRKLPFDPLPLARFPLDSSWRNREVTISGWGANVATGPTTATGGRVQRTGRTRLLGSPSAADSSVCWVLRK